MSRLALLAGVSFIGGAAVIVACTAGRPVSDELTATTSESLTLTSQTNYWVMDGGRHETSIASASRLACGPTGCGIPTGNWVVAWNGSVFCGGGSGSGCYEGAGWESVRKSVFLDLLG